jgi:Na+/H+ antiporter NhaD/arsenite permease-like protein
METAFDIISLVLFIVVILLAFFRKVNVGVVAVTFGVIMVRIFGLTDKDLIGGFSTSMFTTLVGITLLFAAITQTGALDLLARKIIALAGNKMWVLPIMVYIAGFVIAGVGPGAVPALAIIPALAAIIAVEVGFNPLMLVLIGEQGLMAGRMTPITPEAAIITGAAAEANIANVMPTILVCQTLVTIVSSLVFWFIFKGHKVKQPLNPIERGTLEKFNAKQIISLLSIVLMLVLLIFVKVNIGVAAFAVAGLLFLFALPTTARRSSPCPGAPS